MLDLDRAPARFWAKVDRSGNCWLWTAAKVHDGYAKWRYQKQSTLAHRWLYELLVRPVPDGLQLDHLCRVRHCVNPAHLEPVTRGENQRRSPQNIGARTNGRRRKQCPNGHPYDEANAYVWRGIQLCRSCRNVHSRAYKARRRRS